MKKVNFGLAVVVAAAFGVFKATQVSNGVSMSDLQIENLEAPGNGGDTHTSAYPCPGAALEWQIL